MSFSYKKNNMTSCPDGFLAQKVWVQKLLPGRPNPYPIVQVDSGETESVYTRYQVKKITMHSSPDKVPSSEDIRADHNSFFKYPSGASMLSLKLHA